MVVNDWLVTILVPAEQISCIYLVLNIIKNCIIAVCDDGIAHGLKFLNIIYHFAAKEGRTILQCRDADKWFPQTAEEAKCPPFHTHR